MKEDSTYEDVYIGIECDLLAIQDSIITNRHHGSGDNYEDDYPANSIGGIIPSFSLSGWLRHGMEKVMNEQGASVCHPGESNANFKSGDVYDRDLENGYHPKGSCIDGSNSPSDAPSDHDSESGCLIFDLYGGFGGIPGKFMRRPIQFNPVRSAVDYTRGQAEGHYRRVNRNVVSRNEADGRTPLRPTQLDAVANLSGTWQLTFREPKPEFIALLTETVGFHGCTREHSGSTISHGDNHYVEGFLNEHQTDFMHQLGGTRNFGAGIVDVSVLNPLYSMDETNRVFDRSKKPTVRMEEKDEEFYNDELPEMNERMDERI